MKPFYLILIFLCLSQYSNAKSILVEGFVMDKNKNPVVDASIFLYGDAKVKVYETDSLGHFEFHCKRNRPYRLLVLSSTTRIYDKEFIYYFKQRKPFKIRLPKSNWGNPNWKNFNDSSSVEILLSNLVYARSAVDSSNCSIQGIITDVENGEPLMFVTIALKKDGQLITGTQSDFDGKFSFCNLPTGIYQLEFSYIGYYTIITNDFEIKKNEPIEIDAMMIQGIEFDDIVITVYIPINEQDNLTEGTIFNSYEIRRSPSKN
ncbi:MAG: hypothetical protein ACJAUH_000568 [Saprospiraceae bacterium]|jgi:hypothetical protein